MLKDNPVLFIADPDNLNWLINYPLRSAAVVGTPTPWAPTDRVVGRHKSLLTKQCIFINA